jgi:hypothetical protein
MNALAVIFIVLTIVGAALYEARKFKEFKEKAARLRARKQAKIKAQTAPAT